MRNMKVSGRMIVCMVKGPRHFQTEAPMLVNGVKIKNKEMGLRRGQVEESTLVITKPT